MSTDKRILTYIALIHSNESSRPKQNTFNIDKVVSISFNRNKKVKSRVKIRGADYAACVTNSCISPTEECFQDLYTGPL